MKIQFIPTEYSYFDFQERNYAKIYGRDASGKRVCIIDSCPVYLWAILKSDVEKNKIDPLIKKIKKIKLNSKGRQTKIEKVELHEKKFLENPVKALKIFATNHKDLHEIADKLVFKEIDKRRGYDIGYLDHYIMEKEVSPLKWAEVEGEILENSEEFSGIDSVLNVDLCIKAERIKPLDRELPFIPKALAYDIECDEVKVGEGEILMISLVSSDGFKKVITWKKSKVSLKKCDYLEFVNDEAELIEKFSEYVKKNSPDFLVGYFSDGFDMPYLKARAEKHNVTVPIGLDNSQPKFLRAGIGKETSSKIEGISHIDLFKFIKTVYAQYMQSETLSLGEVAKEFLGDSKKEFKHQHSSKLDREGWKKYYEYNLHDSVLVIKLFEKFWPDILEFSRIIQKPVFETSRAGLSKYVESYILHNLKKFNEIPEKRPSYEEIGKRRISGGVKGAFVYEPTPGLYEDIAMFDFTSMHTSIIITHNISKGTLLKKSEKNAIESPELELSGKKTKFYFSKKPGFLSEMLREIFEKRKKYKEEFKKKPDAITKARSNAFKVLSASVHGYIGFFGARYYSLESSASILAFVRKYNIETIEKIKKLGYKVIFADTDSVGFLINGKKESEIKKLLEKLNSELPGIMHLELEDFYKRGIWVTTREGGIGAKKKYALITKSGKTKIRGFETVRRDWCPLARKVQDYVLKQILSDGNEKKALEYVIETIKKIKKREIKKEEIIIKTMLQKPLYEYKAITPHVIAAKRMEEKEIPISGGNLIEYYISETNEKKKLVREKVKLPDEPGEYDIEYYLERQILPAVENIFQVFNIDIKKLINDKKQEELGKWM